MKRIPLWICFNIDVIVIKLCFTFEGIMFVIITPFWFGLRRIGINMHSKKNEIVNDNFSYEVLFYTKSSNKEKLSFLLDSMEIYYIKKYNTYKNFIFEIGENGYLQVVGKPC